MEWSLSAMGFMPAPPWGADANEAPQEAHEVLRTDNRDLLPTNWATAVRSKKLSAAPQRDDGQ